MKLRFALCIATTTLLAACSKEAETPKTAPAPIAARPAPDIKGLRLHESQADVMAKFPTAECKPVEAHAIACNVSGVSYGGSESGILTVAIDGDIKMIRVDLLDKEKFGFMVSGLKSKLGPAEHDGATALSWSGDGWIFAAQLRPDGYHYPGVSLIDTKWIAARMQAQANDAAKTL